jgi:hypothetical protein
MRSGKKDYKTKLLRLFCSGNKVEMRLKENNSYFPKAPLVAGMRVPYSPPLFPYF